MLITAGIARAIKPEKQENKTHVTNQKTNSCAGNN